MKLTGIAIQKFRSIKKTPRLSLGDLTVLLGPNNEGKSNILRALVVSMQLLRTYGVSGGLRTSRGSSGPGPHWNRITSRHYQWLEDFPKGLQEASPEGNSIIDLWFELDEQEQAEFYSRVRSRLRTELPIRVTIGKKGVQFVVRKQGPGGAALTQKSAVVCQFVGARLRVEYVESVRTAERAQAVAEDMIEVELVDLQQDEQFSAALDVLNAALEPVTQRISSELLSTLKDFLPDVQDVSVELATGGIIQALSAQARIVVDDGVATDLKRKGDGIQSLAALALVRKAASRVGRRGALFLAIEEPEAHLHPRAVHQLRMVLAEIASQQQVVLTSHSPLLVDRANVERNIIVRGNQARCASGIDEVRDVLGVRVSDNLASASLLLVVEGGCDKTALHSILASRSKILANALQNGALGIHSLGSASNLSAHLDSLRNQLCQYHVLVDDDSAGQAAAAKARSLNLLDSSEEHFIKAPGLKESEFEDLVDPKLYSAVILEQFGISVEGKEFKNAKKKWSLRVADACQAQGKAWDDAVRAAVKARIASLVAESPDAALHSKKSGAVESLVEALERRLGHK